MVVCGACCHARPVCWLTKALCRKGFVLPVACDRTAPTCVGEVTGAGFVVAPAVEAGAVAAGGRAKGFVPVACGWRGCGGNEDWGKEGWA